MAVKGNSSGPGRSGNKSDRGGSGTLGAGSDFNVQGPAQGFRDGGRDEQGNKIGAVEQGGILGGFFNPGRMVGAGIGSLVAGPIGGLLGGLIGGGIGSGSQRGSWGYTDAQGNRVSAGRDMIDGGGRGRAGDRFEGGLLSGIGNSLGIRPAGYRDRQNAMQAQMTPDQIRAEMAGQAPRSFVPQPASPASPSITPASPAPQAPMTPEAMGQTMPRALTAEDLSRLSQVGMGQGAMVGEPATPQEMAFLVRGPGMVMGMGGPNAYAPFAPDNPAMDATFQGIPGVNLSQPDYGTIRAGVSAGSQAIRRPPSAGSMPPVDTQTYRGFPSAMSQPPMGGQSGLLGSSPRVSQPVQVGAPARVAPSMYQPNAITSTRGPGVAQPYGAAAGQATQRMLDALQAERLNRGNVIRRVYNN